MVTKGGLVNVAQKGLGVRAGVQILYDGFFCPMLLGEYRSGVQFEAGWARTCFGFSISRTLLF